MFKLNKLVPGFWYMYLLLWEALLLQEICAIHTVGGLWMINYFIFRSRGPKEIRPEAHLSFI